MSLGENLSFDAASFSGRVRLFPLPNLVMYPHVLQPLHIFEPRYRAMMEDALDDDRLIAMAVLAPGWEADYEGRPPLRPTACLGRIVTHQEVEGGRYNLLLAGLKRVRIVRELPPLRPFREAEVELLNDVYSVESTEHRNELQRLLLGEFKQILPNMPEVHQQLEELLCHEVSLGMLTDLVAYTLPLSVEMKDSLLCETDVERRCATLLERLRSGEVSLRKGPLPAGSRPTKWPPDFSEN